MTATAIDRDSAGHIRVRGDLSFSTAPELVEILAHDFAPGQTITLDLGAVQRADTAGLALLIEWRRQARRRQCTLNFTRLPQQLQAIATVSGVMELLPGH